MINVGLMMFNGDSCLMDLANIRIEDLPSGNFTSYEPPNSDAPIWRLRHISAHIMFI